MIDPLTRVPGIWRAGMAVSVRGVRGRLSVMNPGAGLNWIADDGRGYLAGFNMADANVEMRAYLDVAILLDDPNGATTGCLAAFCRGLWRIPDIYCRPLLPGGWNVERPFTRPNIVFGDFYGNTEATAWEAAIHAHPSCKDV